MLILRAEDCYSFKASMSTFALAGPTMVESSSSEASRMRFTLLKCGLGLFINFHDRIYQLLGGIYLSILDTSAVNNANSEILTAVGEW